jgi:hypothetical protein
LRDPSRNGYRGDAFALGKLAGLLHEGKRFPEMRNRNVLDAAGIIEQLLIRSLRLKAQGLIARKRGNTAATRRACFGEAFGHVLGSQPYRGNSGRAVSDRSHVLPAA